MESITYSKNLKISPKKLRFLLPEIKKLKPVDVLDYLMYTPRKSAAIFYKVMKSALTDAKNFLKVDEKMLRFKHLSVEEGQKLKRFRPGGRGTTKPILRRFAHVKIILEAETPIVTKEIKQMELKVKTNKSKVQSSNVKSNPKSKS